MPISVMLKPSSSLCNLKCKYCFYSSLSSEREEYSKGFMNLETAESIIKSAVDYTKGTEIIFTFQGGEPMLSGIDFYKSFTELVKKHNTYKSKITYCLQTNGTLMNEEWCVFFKENNFLIGVSLDGNESQNQYRVYPNGSSSFEDVVNGIEMLKKYGVQFNVLSVVTKQLANSVRDNYKFMKKNQIYNFQYINCLKPFDEASDKDLYMNNEDYSAFLEKAFRLYYNDNRMGGSVSVRSFDNYLLLLRGNYAEQCGMNGFCSTQFVVEGDGTVYPCDFYCTDEWELGNINHFSFSEMHKSKKAKGFIEESFAIDEQCQGCSYFALCRGGGCKRSRQDTNFCNAYKKFFSSSLNMMKDLNRII
ncbi:MAG: DUF3641 domain-containing protein [Eubacterium sp.]|nr:DUF3641 domain-containing protein [Eubacterium sp.]